jgi:hypothetical protein
MVGVLEGTNGCAHEYTAPRWGGEDVSCHQGQGENETERQGNLLHRKPPLGVNFGPEKHRTRVKIAYIQDLSRSFLTLFSYVPVICWYAGFCQHKADPSIGIQYPRQRLWAILEAGGER